LNKSHKNSNENIFIFGSSGYIGNRLSQLFIKENTHNIIGLSSKDCNLLSIQDIEKTLSGISKKDVFIITSAITRLKDNSYTSMISNIQMAENLGSFLRDRPHPIAHVIYLSTVEVYGRSSGMNPITEKTLPLPNEYYGISKLTSEFVLRNAFSDNKIPLTVLRLPGIYGPGGEGKSAVNTMITAALKNNKITVYNKGVQKRDYVFIDDVFQFLKHAIKIKKDITINAVTGISLSISEIAKTIISIIGNDCVIELKESDQSSEQRPKNLVYDISLLKNTMPDMVFTDLATGINKIIDKS